MIKCVSQKAHRDRIVSGSLYFFSFNFIGYIRDKQVPSSKCFGHTINLSNPYSSEYATRTHECVIHVLLIGRSQLLSCLARTANVNLLHS
jgi:hypothetical protein